MDQVAKAGEAAATGSPQSTALQTPGQTGKKKKKKNKMCKSRLRCRENRRLRRQKLRELTIARNNNETGEKTIEDDAIAAVNLETTSSPGNDDGPADNGDCATSKGEAIEEREEASATEVANPFLDLPSRVCFNCWEFGHYSMLCKRPRVYVKRLLLQKIERKKQLEKALAKRTKNSFVEISSMRWFGPLCDCLEQMRRVAVRCVQL